MATVIKNTIGSNGREFLTPQAWLDSIPLDLVGINTKYIGEMYNDSEFNTAINVVARTTSADCNITLQCAPGHSAKNQIDGYKTPLFYNQAKGVGTKIIKSSGDYAVNIDAAYTVIDGIQVDYNYSGGRALRVNAPNCSVKYCFFKGRPNHATVQLAAIVGARVEHTLFVYDSDITPNTALLLGPGTELYNVGLVRPSNYTKKGNGVSSINSTAPRPSIVNSYVFGFAGNSSSNFGPTNNNATDGTSLNGATTAMVNLVYADQFVQPSLALPNPDFRLKTTSALADKGINLSATLGNSKDIYGHEYGRGWDIGPAENLEVATAVRFISAPLVGYVSKASENFVVGLDGSFADPVVITPSDGGKGGAFNPTSITITPTTTSGSITYTPVVEGDITITLNNDKGFASKTTTYQSATEATALTWSGIPENGRAGKEITGIKVRANGVVNTATTVTPTDGAGGVFNPTSATLSKAVQELIFSYTGATGGNKNLVLSNNGGLTNPQPVAINLYKPIIAVPSVSDQFNEVKSIGTGKDFENLGLFAAWVKTVDFSVLKKNIIGEVYNNITLGSYTVFNTNVADIGGYEVIVQPVPGFAVSDYDPLNIFGYHDEGIELDLSAFATRISWNYTFRDFRLQVNANMVRMSHANGGKGGTLRRNRIRVRTAGSAFHSGEYAVHGAFYDNLFVRDAGNGSILNTNITRVARNTFVAQGEGFIGAPVINTTTGNIHETSYVWDNVFVNTGNIPVGNPEMFPAGTLVNNYTNQTTTTKSSGIIEIIDTPYVMDDLHDYRPVPGGGIQGKGSLDSIGILDVRKNDRGGIPDPGCVQGSMVTPLSKVTITDVHVDGQDVTVTGTAEFNPISGVAYLEVADEPFGASSIGATPIVITGETFKVTWRNVDAGNYKIPLIYITNAGGVNRVQSGGVPIVILDVVAELVEGETPTPTGGAPIVSFKNMLFDNDVLSIEGLIDNQNDIKATLNVMVQPLPSGDPVAPSIAVNTVNNTWGTQFSNLTGHFKVVATAVANGKTTVLESDMIKIITCNAVVPMPLPPV